LVKYLTAMAIIFGVLTLWVGVQQWARRFARRHPDDCPAPEMHECHRCALAEACSLREAPDAGVATINASGEAK